MRSTRRYLWGAVAVLGACGGDKGPTQVLPNNNTLTATVDGVAFQPTTVTASRTSLRVFISAISGGNTLTISVAAPASPGVVDVVEGDVNSLLYNQGTGAGTPVWSAGSSGAGSGTVTFTTISATEATGTFSFNAQPVLSTPAMNTKVVTSGAFSVKF